MLDGGVSRGIARVNRKIAVCVVFDPVIFWTECFNAIHKMKVFVRNL